MAVVTLGEAWRLGWTCTAHCLWYGPNKRGDRQVPWCDRMFKLDMLTLVLTRGEKFPIERMAEVLRCPKCGFRRMRVIFAPTSIPKPQAIAVNEDE